MSPDRTTITRAEAIRRRKEDEQKRREKLTQKNVSKPRLAPAPQPARPAKPAAKSKTGWPAATSSLSKPGANRWQHRYGIAMSTPYRQTRSFSQPKVPSISINLPRISYGPRWISLFVAIFCALDLYFMLNNDPFIVHAAEITGNNRVTAAEIQSVLGIADLPAAYLDTPRIQANILSSFPDISTARVDVYLPAAVVISVGERTPVVAWHQDGQIVWVDASGYAFPPRGQVDNLPVIVAAGAPPVPGNFDPAQTIGAKPFLQAELIQAIETLSPSLPQGAALVFDPQYGLGWNDPQGWKVYFGQTHGDNAVKLRVYQALVEHLKKNNVQPTMISVEDPDAPYYRVEQ
ncbi:MAG TPA: FtsQ-type POTRA domain-containing protein [Anaerolineales bacterium]